MTNIIVPSDYEIRVKNEAIKYRPTIGYERLEQKLLTLIMLLLKEDSNSITLSIYDILNFFCMSPGGKSYKLVERAIESIKSKQFKITDAQGRTTFISWLNEAIIFKNNNTVMFVVNDAMKRYFFNIEKNYSKINWVYSMGLKYKHSQRIYEILCMNKFKRRNDEVTIQYDELLELLGLQKYKSFYEFDKWVLSKVASEISSSTPFTMSYRKETISTGICIVFKYHEKTPEEIEQIDSLFKDNKKIKLMLESLRSIKDSDYSNINSEEDIISIRKNIEANGLLQLENKSAQPIQIKKTSK